ncbi:MAG TPA: hypothetical protein VFT10_04385 [Solirubrobacterales bacterium]|nr:hypothetical protein [Solirubrobacterales bacterium]
MAEITTLEEKLAEVTGLARAAKDATEEVESLVDSEEAARALQMREEAEETDQRCLTMAEAGEAGHWAVLGKLNEKAGEEGIGSLAQWALPIQERHLSEVKECSLMLAAKEDPNS